MKNLPALDGLRATAILIVVVSHICTPLVPGAFGVTLFFFISGFIITRVMFDQSFDKSKVAGFYVRRFFRLSPALFIYLLIAGVTFSALGFQIPGSDFASTLLYYANYHAFENFGNVLSPLTITWSLAVEEHFYFIFPIVFLIFNGRILNFMLITIGVILVWRLVLVYGLDASTSRTYQSTDTRLDSIAWGCLLSAMIHTRNKHLRWLCTTQAVVLGIIVLASTLAFRDPHFRETLRYSLQGAALMPIFGTLFYTERRYGVVARLLESTQMRFVGNISYSLYLYHFLALGIATALLPPGPIRMGAALIAGFAGATASYYLIENPVRKYGSKLAKSLERTRAVPKMLGSVDER